MAILFWCLVQSERPGRTAWYFGLAHQASNLSWLFLLDPSKNIPTPLLVPLQAMVAIGYVSVFYLLLGWAHGKVRARFGAVRSLLVLPTLWVAMEALRSRGELGFPWCLSGSSIIGGPLFGLARASGEIGVGAGLAFFAALLAGLMLQRKKTEGPFAGRAVVVLAAGAIVVGGLLYVGSQAQPPAPASHLALADSLGVVERPVPVAAIQGNVALTVKWNKAFIDSTKIPHEELSRQAGKEGAELIVWPETAVPAYVLYDAELLQWLRETVISSGAWVYTGFPGANRSAEGKVRTYNSSGLFDPKGARRDRYAKHHLLPIGEYMPFQSIFPFLANIDVGQAEWTAGQPPMPMNVDLADGSFRISSMICFESAFGKLARDSVRRGSQCLVVITNDGWFGESAGPKQHAWLARLRAVECGVPVIRSANNGISFIADKNGNVLDSLGLGRRGIVRAEITPGAGRTLYVKWGAWPVAIWIVAWLLFVLLGPVESRPHES
ncbi:MAG: apolipoprotein N-acyltransferase [Candidatus Krumholzibacteriia bacterium]|jgi:apolipoprotein N-acyltransferase